MYFGLSEEQKSLEENINRFLEDNVDYVDSDRVTSATDQVTMDKFSEIYDFIESFEQYKKKKTKRRENLWK